MHFDRARHQGPAASSLLVLAALSVAVLGSAAPARGEEKANPLNSMLGLFGAKPDKDEEAIDYRPRAPLVVPPSRELPEPKKAVRDPAWPKDPDAQVRRRAALDSRRPVPHSSATATVEPAAKEAQAGPADPAKRDEHEGECLLNDTGPQSCLRAPWKFLSTTFGGAAPDTAKPGVEPVRKVLTEPPAGYRAANVVPETPDAKSKSETDPGPFDSFLEVLGVKKSTDN